MNSIHNYPFRKTALATALGLGLCSGQAGAVDWVFSGTFTHYDSSGTPSGHVDTLVSGIFNLTAGTGSFNSGINFQGSPWIADVDKMFQYDTNAGGTQNYTYSWTNKVFFGTAVVNCRTGSGNLDGCAGVTGTLLVSTPNSYSFSMTNPGQFAAGMFFDWSVNLDIPVLAVMQGLDDPSDGEFAVISLDSDGDGVPGTAMITQPFPGHTADFKGTLKIPGCTYNVVPPAGVTGKTASGTSTGMVNIGSATVTEISSGNALTPSAVRESDSGTLTPNALNSFNTGTDRVIWDKLNTNETGCEALQTVIMHEWDPPADVTVTADVPATVTLGTPTDLGNPADYPNGVGLVFSNDAPASGFGFGTTTVTWTATDDAGGTTTATQDVTVNLPDGIAGAPCTIDLATAGDRQVHATFTMRTPTGAVSGTPDTKVTGSIDTTAICPDEVCQDPNGAPGDQIVGAALGTTVPFNGAVWNATPIRLFDVGTWTFEACPGDTSTFCNIPLPPRPVGMTVKDAASNGGIPQLGAHMLFEWSGNEAIDVVVVWDVDCGAAMLTTTDPDGDGILGTRMVDGPFIGWNAAFDVSTDTGEQPITAGGYEVAVPAYQSPIAGGSPRLLNPTVLAAADIPADGSMDASCLLGGCWSYTLNVAPGSSANIVFPLSDVLPYYIVPRKFLNGVWKDFTIDADNSIRTAPRVASGLCPEPGSASYQLPSTNNLVTGMLNPGDECVQLTIKDDGANDSASTTPGVITDPFSLSLTQPTVNLDAATTGSGGGGCSIGKASVRPSQRADWLLLLGFLVLVGGYGARRRQH